MTLLEKTEIEMEVASLYNYFRSHINVKIRNDYQMILKRFVQKSLNQGADPYLLHPFIDHRMLELKYMTKYTIY